MNKSKRHGGLCSHLLPLSVVAFALVPSEAFAANVHDTLQSMVPDVLGTAGSALLSVAPFVVLGAALAVVAFVVDLVVTNVRNGKG